MAWAEDMGHGTGDWGSGGRLATVKSTDEPSVFGPLTGLTWGKGRDRAFPIHALAGSPVGHSSIRPGLPAFPERLRQTKHGRNPSADSLLASVKLFSVCHTAAGCGQGHAAVRPETAVACRHEPPDDPGFSSCM
jgi:hypothetical protein